VLFGRVAVGAPYLAAAALAVVALAVVPRSSGEAPPA